MSDTTSGGASAEQVKNEAAREADRLQGTARHEGAKLADTARDLGRERAEQTFETGKARVEEQVDVVNAAVDDAASRLQDEGHPFASYAADLSSQLSTLSSRIESSSLDELVRDGRRVAHENPGLFTLGAVALGFAAARFLKASDQRSEHAYVDVDRGSYDDDSADADLDYDAYARHRRSTLASAAPYRRAARSAPVAPVPMDSTAATSQPRINPPINDLDRRVDGVAPTTNV